MPDQLFLSGWLPCDGASKVRTDFPALFTAIGTTYGSVDGTHFTLPDARGRTAIGVGTGAGLTARALGAKLGEEKHILTVQELATHSHVQNAHSHGILGTQVILVTAGGAAIAQVFGTSTTDPATAVNHPKPMATIPLLFFITTQPGQLIQWKTVPAQRMDRQW